MVQLLRVAIQLHLIRGWNLLCEALLMRKALPWNKSWTIQLCRNTFCVQKLPAVNVIYWCGGGEMPHCSQHCPILVAVARGRTIRTREVCQVCLPETVSTVIVTAKGSKYHCSGCQTVEKSMRLELEKCPMCYEKLDKTD